MTMASAGHDLSAPLPAAPPSKTSLPISRSSGTAYERPERARTSHACEPCRERKTKCDGERPTCRRCAHTGTHCHYGYGKGWRKRKTAEDLNTTSRRLARYEALLNEIMPHVPPNVKQMIEDAREQDAAASNSGGSETTETPDGVRMSGIEPSRSNSTSNPRVALPFPIPTTAATPLANQPPHPPPLARPFDSMSSMSPVSTTATIPRSDSRHSPDDTGPRLPSITPHGLLIEPSLRGETGAPVASHQSDPALYTTEQRQNGDPSPPEVNQADIAGFRSAPG